MNNKVTITVEPADPELSRQMALYQHNAIWASDHWSLFGDEYRGKYVAVSQGELFVADSRQEAERLAQAKHPDDEPFISYIPKAKYERIYAY